MLGKNRVKVGLQKLQKQPPEVFYKNTVLKNFAIFTAKHLCWSSFLIKLQVFRPTALLKRDFNRGVFLWILWNFKKYLFWRTSANGCSSNWRMQSLEKCGKVSSFNNSDRYGTMTGREIKLKCVILWLDKKSSVQQQYVLAYG